MTIPASKRGYEAAGRTVALIDRSDRVRIEVTGPDRAKMLHNLTTNDIKRLRPGASVEAFLTSPQGRTLGLLSIHAEEDRLLVRSDPGTSAAILGHLAKFGVFEDANARDVSAETVEWHLIGPPAEAVAATVADPSTGARTIPESPTARPGLTLIRQLDAAGGLADRLLRTVEGLGGSPLSLDEFDAMRIEAGTPIFGRDVAASNLPQEVDRDARAISFVKGCYLGQETVARLDALGHVNKILIAALADPGPLPTPGAILRAEAKDVGVVTSSAYSSGWSRGVILGYAKVAFASPGSRLTAVSGEESIRLEVRPRPMLPDGAAAFA